MKELERMVRQSAGVPDFTSTMLDLQRKVAEMAEGYRQRIVAESAGR
jgi:hypothetical protein